MPLVRRARGTGSDQRTPGKRPGGDDETDGEDEGGARGRQRANERPVERQTRERASSEDRDEADRRDRRREAEAEGDDQRQPEADPVERDRRQQDDERGGTGKQAGRDSHAEDPLRGQRVVVVVVVVVPVAVVVVVSVRVALVNTAARTEPLAQDGRADEDDEQPRDEREPRVELLGNDERRQAEGHEPEREDARRVRDRDGAAEHEGMTRRSLRSDEVRGDHRFPVSRRERVRSAPERRDQKREEEHADREVSLLDQCLEPAVAVLAARRLRRSKALRRPSSRARSRRSPPRRRGASGAGRTGTSAARHSRSSPGRPQRRPALRPAR